MKHIQTYQDFLNEKEEKVGGWADIMKGIKSGGSDLGP